MHAVILTKNPRYVLCHIRRITETDVAVNKRKKSIPQKKFKQNCDDAPSDQQHIFSPIENDKSCLMSVEVGYTRTTVSTDYISMMNSLSGFKFPEWESDEEPTFKIVRN